MKGALRRLRRRGSQLIRSTEQLLRENNVQVAEHSTDTCTLNLSGLEQREVKCLAEGHNMSPGIELTTLRSYGCPADTGWHREETDPGASYWNRDLATSTTFFLETMPRDRVLTFLQNLHFNSVAENSRTLYVPIQDICTDEDLCKFKGRLRFKQYNPTKRACFGVKVYKVCQSTGRACGYTWNYKIYSGQSRLALPVSTLASIDVVLSLNENLFDKGYNIYMDNWFPSPDLFQQLKARRTNACETVRAHRKNIPPDLHKIKLRKGATTYQCTDSGILALVRRAKKNVCMLSTMHSESTKDTRKQDADGNTIMKPSVVVSYDVGMGGVDHSDQLATTHKSGRKFVKWYKKMFLYIADICVVNSHLIWQMLGGVGGRLTFENLLFREMTDASDLPKYT
uniref:PiggyBac transposable element-derived protein domain-containing protein n=1 Tax=Octopus bimaculoides TaxID=37653 RepID=A0A0L8HTK5_OCTBM